MKWLAKAMAHWALSVLPGGSTLHYMVQRRLSSISDEFDAAIEAAQAHFATVTSFAPLRNDARYFEFGAGWHLIQPLIFWAQGIRRQTIIDVRRLARIDVVNAALLKLRTLGYELPVSVQSFDDLRVLGIDYQAPEDGRFLTLSPSSVRYIANTNTLEHVPAGHIRAILLSCYKILADDGVFSIRIDYADHYSYTDKHIDPVHFLRYGPLTWRIFNPPTHYQNRLRHSDYLAMIRDAGFAVLHERVVEEPSLAAAELHGYSRSDVVTLSSYLAMMKRSANRPT